MRTWRSFWKDRFNDGPWRSNFNASWSAIPQLCHTPPIGLEEPCMFPRNLVWRKWQPKWLWWSNLPKSGNYCYVKMSFIIPPPLLYFQIGGSAHSRCQCGIDYIYKNCNMYVRATHLWLWWENILLSGSLRLTSSSMQSAWGYWHRPSPTKEAVSAPTDAYKILFSHTLAENIQGKIQRLAHQQTYEGAHQLYSVRIFFHLLVVVFGFLDYQLSDVLLLDARATFGITYRALFFFFQQYQWYLSFIPFSKFSPFSYCLISPSVFGSI